MLSAENHGLVEQGRSLAETVIQPEKDRTDVNSSREDIVSNMALCRFKPGYYRSLRLREEVVADAADGGGEAVLAVRHDAEQRDSA